MLQTRPELRTRRAVATLALAAMAVLVARNAWISDDGFITLRTVAHALDGHGLRFNVAERVQAYTHPLWMVLLLAVHGLTGGPYLGTLALGGLVTLSGLALLWGHARSITAGLTATLLLAGSKAFVDYATSGLENPLTHVLLLLGFASLVRGGSRPIDLLRSSLVLGLALLNRLDALVLAGPLLAAHVHRAGRSALTARHGLALLAGLAPLFVWEGFALVYYGSLVPNTALAKLGTGIPRDERMVQGLRYLAHPFLYDRPTALALVALPGLALRADGPGRALVMGVALHLAWVVWVGGDFMAGRLLTPAVLAAALLIARTSWRRAALAPLAGLLAVLAVASPHAPVWSGRTVVKVPPWSGIADERAFYHRATGLLAAADPSTHRFAREGQRAAGRGQRLVRRATIGLFGYYAGPTVHVLDPLGLAEPLLARLPARYDPDWRVGHYRRAVPAGYDPSTGASPDDPEVRALDEQVRRLTRGPLTRPGRLLEALRRMHPDPGFDPWSYRFDGIAIVDAATIGPTEVGPRGIVLRFPEAEVSPAAALGRTRWRVLYGRGTRVLASHDVEGTGSAPQPLPPSPGPVDRLYLFPRIERGTGALGGLHLQAAAPPARIGP